MRKRNRETRELQKIRRKLGVRIRTTRTRRGLTVEQLAQNCGLGRKLILEVENGERNFKLMDFVAIVKGLKTSVEALTHGIF